MNEQTINPALCGTGLSLSNRTEVLTEIARRVSIALPEIDIAVIQSAFERREKIGSTGLEKGIAIPHCALVEAERFAVGIITLSTAIDYRAIDGQKSDIFLFIAGPESQRNEHVRIMAALTAQLRREDVRTHLREAAGGTELAALLEEGVRHGEKSEADRFTLLLVHVQNRDLFEPILELVTGESDSSVSVSEGQSASAILNRMPLFATFWNESETKQIHRIEVVIPRERVNRTIRRIEELVGTQSGVQISALDLGYAAGRLDL